MPQAIEKLKDKPIPKKRGGPRPGSGRKKGKRDAKQLEKMRTFEEYKARIQRNADVLFNTQMQLVRGCSYLYRIDKDEKGRKQKAALVTSPDEIANYLEGMYEDDEDSYYFITTDKPNTITISDMLDRAFGKAAQPLRGENEGDAIKVRVISVDPAIAEKYDLNTSPKDNSGGSAPVSGS